MRCPMWEKGGIIMRHTAARQFKIAQRLDSPSVLKPSRFQPPLSAIFMKPISRFFLSNKNCALLICFLYIIFSLYLPCFSALILTLSGNRYTTK